jgi:hypothetical protein
MRKMIQIAFALLASLGMSLCLIACQVGQLGQQACSRVSLPEMDMVRGIEYKPGNFVPGYDLSGAMLAQADLGSVYDSISVDIHGCPPPATGNYSTFLADGTQLYTIKGYWPWFRLAVKETDSSANQVYLIEAMDNPRATTGGELMQLDNVDAVLLYSQESLRTTPTPSPMKAARSPQQVTKLIVLFDQAPIPARKPGFKGQVDELVFHFRDGTISGMLYDPTTGWTQRGVALPPAFATLLLGS